MDDAIPGHVFVDGIRKKDDLSMKKELNKQRSSIGPSSRVLLDFLSLLLLILDFDFLIK